MLEQLGIALPAVVAPLASYVPAVRTGNLVYTAGQLPMQAGKLLGTGKVGAKVSPDEGKALARVCALNALAAVNSVVGIDQVTRVVKVVGFVASAADFNGQPSVVNGASDLLAEVFGDKGAHARSAVGVSELPLNAPVEVELIVEVG
jgi:enamine deaminase RidA (YjgF/YER057c/UK114 family)